MSLVITKDGRKWHACDARWNCKRRAVVSKQGIGDSSTSELCLYHFILEANNQATLKEIGAIFLPINEDTP